MFRARLGSGIRPAILPALVGVLALTFARDAAFSGDNPTDAAPANAGVTMPPRTLVFSTRHWKGEFASKDIPGGVETTPVTGAIHSIRDDGTQFRKIIEVGQRTEYPVPSPNGEWVYFQSNASGRTQVYRCRWDGAQVTNLTAGDRLGAEWTEAYGFALSHDGSKLLFTAHNGTFGQIAIAAADGANPRFVAPRLGYIYMGALSPTGDRLVFSGPARGYRLWQMQLPDGEPQLLTPEHPDSFVPQFTPDGKTIIFLRRDGDIYRIDADGKNLQRLTSGNKYVEFRLSLDDRHGSTDGPRISPDGRQVAYLAVRDGVANVWVMNIDGTDAHQVTFRSAGCGRVRWSPEGRDLAFVSFVGKYPQLFVVPRAGGEPRQLTHLDAAVYFVEWRAAE